MTTEQRLEAARQKHDHLPASRQKVLVKFEILELEAELIFQEFIRVTERNERSDNHKKTRAW